MGVCAVFSITPGPDNLTVIATGLSTGKKAAFFMAMGMCSGVSLHTLAAAFGISAVFYTSALAFNFVKLAGAAYLLFLAAKTLLSQNAVPTALIAQKTAGQYYMRGFLLNVLNPKVALFFLAFLPQFVDPGKGTVSLQICTLGFLFVIPAIIIFSLISVFSGTIGKTLFQKPLAARSMKIASAAVLAALGIRLAVSRQ